MTHRFEGSKSELHRAVMLVAYAEGRLATMQRLEDLEHAARAWRERLDVDPKITDMIEEHRDREMAKAA